MKKALVTAGAVVALGAAIALGVSAQGLDAKRCYVRPAGSAPETCECQGNELLLNRSPRNTKNFPEWGDCGAIPRPGSLMRGPGCVVAACPSSPDAGRALLNSGAP